MIQIKPNLLIAFCLGVLVFWSGTVALSSHLSKGFVRKQHARGNVSESETTAPEHIMGAISRLEGILKSDPNNTEALLALGELAFEFGVIDKAKPMFERYLALVPRDEKARVDYSLVLLRGSEADRAISELNAIIKDHPELFQAHLALALAYHISGNNQRAKQVAEAARTFAPDEAGKDMIASFLSQLQASEESKSAPPPGEESSPAKAIDAFFRNHQIIGPKLASIDWADAGHVRILVNDFPVEAMPQFAKDTFTAKVRAAFSVFKEPVLVQITDSATDRTLMEIKVGPEASAK